MYRQGEEYQRRGFSRTYGDDDNHFMRLVEDRIRKSVHKKKKRSRPGVTSESRVEAFSLPKVMHSSTGVIIEKEDSLRGVNDEYRLKESYIKTRDRR